jgi:hypothetical protein
MMTYITNGVSLALFAAATAAALAQAPAPNNNPTERIVTGATTPERVIADLEASAKRQKDRGGPPASRGFTYRTGLPDSAPEFARSPAIR